MTVTINGTTGIDTPGLNNSGPLAGTTGMFSGLISANGGQIKFPGTQIASADANTLDDYEEGTWTPTLNGFTTSGTLTLSGSYVKVGRLVTLTWRLQSTVSITAAQGSNLGGVPFNQAVFGCGSNLASGANEMGSCGAANNLVYFSKAFTSADIQGSCIYYTNT